MTFFDIFSKKQGKSKKNKKIKIIVDNRERNSSVIAELISKNVEVEMKQLEVADYIINDIAIERKTFSDLQSSIINKRILDQLRNLKQYKKSLLIVEGESDLFIHENAMRGLLLSIALDFQTPIIFTKDASDTANYLLVLAKKTEFKESSLRQSITFKSKEEQIQYILEGFPGIGPVNAKKLLSKFKSIRNIINSNEEELKDVLGKKSEDFKKFLD